ncbi:DUF397 domain-containing protein [Streptomyces sp. NPDC004673]
MDRNLYALPTEGAEFQKFCGGNLGGENETCVKFAQLPGAESAFVLADSKPEGAGKEVRFTGAELDAFVLGYAARRGLTL